LLSILIKK